MGKNRVWVFSQLQESSGFRGYNTVADERGGGRLTHNPGLRVGISNLPWCTCLFTEPSPYPFSISNTTRKSSHSKLTCYANRKPTM